MPFPPTSRYHLIETAIYEAPSPTGGAGLEPRGPGSAGKLVAYLRRRFLPPLERFTVLQEHAVTQGDRLDNVTALYLGDPEQFWRICDANGAMRPDELTEEIGRRIRITLPEGLSGTPGMSGMSNV